MREYRGAEIRNIAVVGHGASGKTSLVDALAFVSGSSKRHGSVKDGTALTDHAAEEIERGYSINLGPAYAEWQDTKINLIDTPGYLDFQGDAIAGLAASDGALCVVSATHGVETGTERTFRDAVRRGDPVLFVVSMMDKEHADFYGALDAMSAFYKAPVEKESRSLMNVVFRLSSEALEEKFVAEAKKQGMVGLKGHRSAGGIRVSTYNAVTVENVKTLVSFLERFAKANG